MSVEDREETHEDARLAVGPEPMAKAPLAQTSSGLCLGSQTKGPAGPVPHPSLEAPPPEENAQCPASAQGTKRKRPQWRALTGLQGGQWFRLLAELTVPDVIGGLHSELVGREGLEPV